MRSSKHLLGIMVVGALGASAVSCGSDDTASDAPDASAVADTDVAADTDAAGETTPATEAGSTSPEGATPVADADNPAAFGTSTLSEEGQFGVDPDNPDLYVGAGGFEIDLADCPGDYDITQGITDTEIRLAHSLPRSGPVAGFGIISEGMSSYFDYVNETFGGIDGRQISLDVKDDAYDVARIQANVTELLGSRDYAAFPGILGTPNNLAVWDELNDECMPQINVASGGAQFGDADNHPWTTGLQLDYVSEAGLWAEYLKSEYPDGVTVAAIVYNNDFGESYAGGFERATEGSNIELVAEELHEPASPNLTNQFTTLADSNAEVLLIETSAAFCTQALSEVEKRDWDPVVIMSSTCASVAQYFQPLIDEGLTGDGTYLIQYWKDPNDPDLADDPYIQLYKNTATAQGLDPNETTYFTGWIFAWWTTEILQLASTLDGGLTRPNIIIANRSMQAQYPGLVGNLAGHMQGLDDAYMVEGGQLVQYTVTDPTELGSYVPVGEVIDNEGALGTYDDVQSG